MSTGIETKVKTYKNTKDFNKDAEKMLMDGWQFDISQNRPGKVVREAKTYKGSGEYEKDVSKMAKDGWRVINTVETQPNARLKRKMLLGPGTLAFRPKPEIVVMYEKGEAIVTYTRPKT